MSGGRAANETVPLDERMAAEIVPICAGEPQREVEATSNRR